MPPDDEHRLLLVPGQAPRTQHWTSQARRRTKNLLTSRPGHLLILLLVSLDVSTIFADLIITSLTCEGYIPPLEAQKTSFALGIVSLVFSCLFMVELLASIWAFGISFFKSYFHCFDAVVIVAGFVIDILLRGTIEEEIGSIVVVLRLWRVLKIIDELSAGAAEQMEPLNERVSELEKQNGELQREIEELKQQRQDR